VGQQIEHLRENGFDEAQIQELEENRGDWINRDKGELERQQKPKMQKTGGSQQPIGAEQPSPAAQEGILHRILKTFTINTNANFTATESYRQLASGQSLMEIWRLEQDAKERTNSLRRNRSTITRSLHPLTWVSIGTNVSTTDSFQKRSGSAYISSAETYEADIKLNAQEASSFQLRYSFTSRNNANLETTLSDSTAHIPSLSWIHTWAQDTRTSLGIRTTLRDKERSGIESTVFIVTPNLSIDYRYRNEGGIRVPFFGRIPLKHDLELTNTFSWAIRREEFGPNLEERSERHETTLRVGYKLSTHLTANLHLGISYNHDRVEEGRDFLSVASALPGRGEFQ